MHFMVYIQVALAVVLSIIILVQQQGTGLGGAFGGEGNVYRSKRGVEKLLFYGTIVLSIAFFTSILVPLVVNR